MTPPEEPISKSMYFVAALTGLLGFLFFVLVGVALIALGFDAKGVKAFILGSFLLIFSFVGLCAGLVLLSLDRSRRNKDGTS